MMKHTILFLFAITAITCADKEDEQPVEEFINKINYNIIIAPDLSNRIDSKIHPKPVADTVIVNDIFDSSEVIVKLNHRSAHQKDIIALDFINAGALNELDLNLNEVRIDFNRFGIRQLERSDYIRKGLNQDIRTAKKNVKAIYEYALRNQHGADIYNYLNSTVNNSLVSEETSIVEQLDGPAIHTTFDNVIILFTDGYIENTTKAPGYTFKQSTINNIRKEFNLRGEKDLNKFISQNPDFQINPLSNKTVETARILVVEMIDRSLDENGVATQYPTDFDIMRAVWRTWFEQSSIQDYEFVSAQNTPDKVLTQILKFISKPQSVTKINE